MFQLSTAVLTLLENIQMKDMNKNNTHGVYSPWITNKTAHPVFPLLMWLLMKANQRRKEETINLSPPHTFENCIVNPQSGSH